MFEQKKDFPENGKPLFCARNRTRTCTTLRSLVPETSASTNSAIRAIAVQKYKIIANKKYLLQNDYINNI